MNHKLIILLASWAMLAIVSCGNNESSNKSTTNAAKTAAVSNLPKAETGEFKIDIPKGWTSKTSEMNGIKYLFLMAPKVSDFQANLNVLKDDMHGRDMDAYIAFNMDQLKPLNPQNLKQDDIDINGIKSKVLTYTAVYQGHDLAFGSYVIPSKNGMAYVITTTAAIKEWQAIAPTFTSTVHSFTIK